MPDDDRQELAHGRYRILRGLGRGATATTFEAEDAVSGKKVALKRFTLRGAREWSEVERFEREAQLLASLDHPVIPKYVEHYTSEGADGDVELCLVQQLAPGQSLAARVPRGLRMTDADVCAVARAVLGALEYMHAREPALIHRDIKPEHVLVSDDERVSLVDFGSARARNGNTVIGGVTVAGTFGYMAPEQLRGKATPQTDLYGLGATLLFALTGKPLHEFPLRRGRIVVGDAVSPAFARWLARMLHPEAESRFASASAALAALPSGRRFDARPWLRAGASAMLGAAGALLVVGVHARLEQAAAPPSPAQPVIAPPQPGPIAPVAPAFYRLASSPGYDNLPTPPVIPRAVPVRERTALSAPEAPTADTCIVSYRVNGSVYAAPVQHGVSPRACAVAAEADVFRTCKSKGYGGNFEATGQLNVVSPSGTTSLDFHANCTDSPYARAVCLPDPCPAGKIKNASCQCVSPTLDRF